MKDTDDLLRRHPVAPKRQLSSDFTNNVIQHIEQRESGTLLKRSLREVHMKLLRLPKFALIALVILAAGTVTTAGYAAVNWLIPKITVLDISSNNDDNKREFLMDVKDCGVMVGGQTADNGKQRYEVAKDANLTDEQVFKVINNSCKYQQFSRFDPWKDNSMPGAGASNITNDPSIGTITAMDESHVTIKSKVYQDYTGPDSIPAGQPVPDFETFVTHYPKGKELTRTFTLSPQADVYADGKPVLRSELKVGDNVYFLSVAKSYDNPASFGDKYGLPTTVLHFVKTDIDPTYVQPAMMGDPSIVNAVTRIVGCQGNGQYLCVDGMKMNMPSKMVYAANVMQDLPAEYSDTFKDNKKYFRTDIDDMHAGDKYHHIEGRITKMDGTHLELRSRGKVDTFSVTLPYDAVKQFNQTAKQKLSVDDYVKVDFYQNPNEGLTTVKSTDIVGLTLLLRQLGDGTYVKY